MITRIKCALVLAALSGSSATAACTGSSETWDVIVVGSGPGGLVASDRLSATGLKTLLLEQGPASYYSTGGRARPSWLDGTQLSRVDVPGLYKSIFSNTDGNLICPSYVVNAYNGCGVGGSTAINAGLFFQPPASDWDTYFPSGWKNADMQSAIAKVRAKQPFTDKPSVDGKRYLQSGYDVAKDWLVGRAGYTEKALNDGPEAHNLTKAFGHPVYNYEGGQRSGPVKTYLSTAMQRANFSFQTGVRVLRILRDGATATGVEVQTAGPLSSTTRSICLKPNGRIVSSAGALLTPQLLMWSGIGPAAILTNLSAMGLNKQPSSAWINNTAVGAGIFDNPNTFIELSSPRISSYQYSYSNPVSADAALYLSSRSGPYSFASQTSAFWTYIPQSSGTAIGVQGTIDSSGAFDYTQNGTITLNVYGTSGLRSTGSVGIDKNGIALPNLKFYSDPADSRAVATFIRDIFAALPADVTSLNVAKTSTLDQLIKWITTGSQYTLGNVQHWSSSCRLGSCVDVNARVVGMKNVYVADASIVAPLSVNPVFGIMVAAERAVERMLGR